MYKALSSLTIAALLTACGGGGDDSTAPSGPVATAPAPVATAPTTVSAPPPAPSSMAMSARAFTNTGSAGNYVVNFNGMTDLTLTGDLNNLWLGAAQAGGTVTINGASNTIVFKLTSTPTTVSVTGSANTFYLPEGSPIKLEGSGAAMSTVKYYKA